MNPITTGTAKSSPVSLLWRILFSTSIAITLLFLAVGWAIQNQFVRIATLSLEQEARASFQAYESLWRSRADQLATVSLVLSRMPDVRSAFSTHDKATIRLACLCRNDGFELGRIVNRGPCFGKEWDRKRIGGLGQGGCSSR
jgi:hypothetical protein